MDGDGCFLPDHLQVLDFLGGILYGGPDLDGVLEQATEQVQLQVHGAVRNPGLLSFLNMPLDVGEPFYQLMRQQLLAHEMEKARELDAVVVSLLHVAPSHNKDFRKVTSQELESLGDTATGVWKRLVKTPGRFLSVGTEQLFGSLLASPPAEMKPWADYLTQRYPWVAGTMREE